MIYKDKEYKEVLDGSAEVGDLVHVVKLDNVPLDFYALITRFDTEGDKRLDSLLPDNTDFLIDDDDTDFKVYRYVKEEERTLTEHNVQEETQEETQGVYVVASEIWEEDSEDFDVDLFILDTKEEAQQHVKAMGNVTRIRHRSTAKREVYIQEVADTTKEIRIYHVKDYNPNKTLVL